MKIRHNFLSSSGKPMVKIVYSELTFQGGKCFKAGENIENREPYFNPVFFDDRVKWSSIHDSCQRLDRKSSTQHGQQQIRAVIKADKAVILKKSVIAIQQPNSD